jgi:pyridinium-3,5-bisthiocarboxylic acid mononucleotide nickel chelatase
VIAWVDASSGASGDMLLGALVGAGVPVEVIEEAVRAVAPEAVTLSTEDVRRNGFAATRCHVSVADSSTHRTWRSLRTMVTGRAYDVFERLAIAEATVHGTTPEDVHFHEVGALDAIADVVGVCAGFEHLGIESLVVSPIAVGSGTIAGAHGTMPVPPPAVAELLRGVPSYAGPGDSELCTPTGAALLTTLATSYGPQPAMSVDAIGIGAGGRDPATHANVLRLFVGHGFEAPLAPVLVETNIDDLDPRLWPNVLQTLLDVGASDAWLSPILMKKGRPAHTLHVLVSGDKLDLVRREVFRQTSTIGVREIALGKTALDRETRTVLVAGHDVRVKLAYLDGELLNAQPEYVDVAEVAEKTGRPIKDVLAEAIAATRGL